MSKTKYIGLPKSSEFSTKLHPKKGEKRGKKDKKFDDLLDHLKNGVGAKKHVFEEISMRSID